MATKNQIDSFIIPHDNVLDDLVYYGKSDKIKTRKRKMVNPSKVEHSSPTTDVPVKKGRQEKKSSAKMDGPILNIHPPYMYSIILCPKCIGQSNKCNSIQHSEDQFSMTLMVCKKCLETNKKMTELIREVVNPTK